MENFPPCLVLNYNTERKNFGEGAFLGFFSKTLANWRNFFVKRGRGFIPQSPSYVYAPAIV